jgi:phosphoesterase RecJ-like protein
LTVDLSGYLGVVPDRVVDRIRGARCVLAVGHENPDADTLGASLAVARIVEAHGGSADVVCTDPAPPLYDFLPGIEGVLSDPRDGIDYDLIVFSDCGTLDRVGDVGVRHRELFERLPRVVIDHHASNDAVGDADWIERDAAATCEMVALLALQLGLSLDLGDGAMATQLMAGIVMDTATFAHSSTTPRTLAIAAALREVGAPLADISRRIYRSKPTAQLRLFGRVLERLATTEDGRVIHSTLLDADLVATGTQAAHSEGIIDLLAQSEEAEVAIVFKEAGTTTRVSVRTKPGGVDATVLTGAFGGGGHARAAGATVPLPVDEARTAVLAEARRLVSDVVR